MYKKELEGCTSILDAGCGRDSLLLRLGINGKQITGLDIWHDYAIKNWLDPHYTDYYKADLTQVTLPPRSFDAVILSDVIEHIDKITAADTFLFNRVITWARKKVIIMTPYGLVDNGSYDGNPFLYHKSGWMPHELERYGFKVRLTLRIRRKKYWGIPGLELFRTIFAVREIKGA